MRSPYGARVSRRGVRIALGQLIYGQDALIPAQTHINNGNVGQSPVYARTDREGVATFHVRDDQSENGNAVYFQAWIAPANGYPFGYSDIVSVLWR